MPFLPPNQQRQSNGTDIYLFTTKNQHTVYRRFNLESEFPSGIEEDLRLDLLAYFVVQTHAHNHFIALWILSGTTWVSQYQKKCPNLPKIAVFHP